MHARKAIFISTEYAIIEYQHIKLLVGQNIGELTGLPMIVTTVEAGTGGAAEDPSEYRILLACACMQVTMM